MGLKEGFSAVEEGRVVAQGFEAAEAPDLFGWVHEYGWMRCRWGGLED